MRVVLAATFYLLKIFFRIKQAVFFSIAFPIFMFILFNYVWMFKGDPYYAFFLLTGIIGMTIATDGIFVVGPVVKEYYQDGLVRYLRKIPLTMIYHFIGVVISRLLILISIIVVLILIAHYLFEYQPTLGDVVNIYIATVIGFFLFSFVGLTLAFASIKESGGGRNLSNFFYFVVIFVSDTFYPVSELNPTIAKIANLFPLNPILEFARGEDLNYIIFVWMALSIAAFYFFFQRLNFDRK